ncbi:MAG: hypothetical protein QOE61_600 [Micromonosporaceae bacterium]|jgi:hypothetical protein|nr:hypothetical protein [Micromonosporaceae bacterium]
MKAEVAFTPLLTAARALKPYTTPRRTRTRTPLLHLHADGDTLTLSATIGDESASVPLSGAVSDGWCALPPDTVIKALTAIKPAGKAAQAATVTVHGEADRLYLSLGDGPAVGLDTDIPEGDPATVAARPEPHEQPVTCGPVADWCDLIAGVATAAGRHAARSELVVVRLLRDHPQVVLMVEATDSYRIHRGTWGDPDGEPVDVRMPADAARRAVRLLHTLDPAGQVRVHADDTHVVWRTDRIRLAAKNGGRAFPNLEKIREDVLDDATNTFSVNRIELVAALNTAHDLTATTQHPRVRLEPGRAGVLDVVVRTDSGAPMHTTPVAITGVSGPARSLILNPAFAQQVFTFLDGDTVAVHAIADRLPIYLQGARRHAILMQIVG